MDSICVPLNKLMIDLIFEGAKHQSDYISGLYEQVIPDWDKINRVNGYPAMSKKTSDYIWAKVIQFDAKYHPDVVAGGGWMNNGFTVNKSLPDWIVEYDKSILIYNEISEREN